MSKKAVFFDIDGTLWDRGNPVPDDTADAIAQLQKNDHLAFINTGRSMGHVYDESLMRIKWDGIVSGCGTRITIGDKLIKNVIFSAEEWERIIKLSKAYNVRMIIEGTEFIYYDHEDYDDDEYGIMLTRELGDKYRRTISGEWGRWEAGKFSVDLDPDTPADGWFAGLSGIFKFISHTDLIYEVVPKDCDKSNGMKIVCDELGLTLADTIAVGDGVNDIGMMQAAGTSICMGNGMQQAKDIADYVTGTADGGGISQALRHLGLI